MSQPTEDHIRQIKERQAEFERRLIDMERYISPIKFTQLEVDSGRVLRRIDEIQKNTNITKILVEGVSGDLLQIREPQVDLRDRLVAHGQRLESIGQKQETHTEILGQLMSFGERIEATMATKDDVSRLEATMATKDDVSRLEAAMATKDDVSRLEATITATKDDVSRLEATMATKDDVSRLEARIGQIETTQRRQEQFLQAILDRLPPKQ